MHSSLSGELVAQAPSHSCDVVEFQHHKYFFYFVQTKDLTFLLANLHEHISQGGFKFQLFCWRIGFTGQSNTLFFSICEIVWYGLGLINLLNTVDMESSA